MSSNVDHLAGAIKRGPAAVSHAGVSIKSLYPHQQVRHSDGSTTLHRHKTCRRLSQDSVYAFDDVDADAVKNHEADTEVVETLKKPTQMSKLSQDDGAIAKVMSH